MTSMFRTPVRHALVALMALGTALGFALPVSGEPPAPGAAVPTVVEVDPALRTGASAGTAAASCWEIKQLHTASADGAYWLLTPSMTEPQQFWCDMTTDGGGWVRIGAGREQWSTTYDGKGGSTELLASQPPLTRGIQLPSTTVDALLDRGRVDDLPDGIRFVRALNNSGSSWQEGRFAYVNRDRWVWSLGAEHRVATWQVGGTSGTGGQTNSFGTGQSIGRVSTAIQSTQGYRWGFAYGTTVAGTNSASTYLWSASPGAGSAMPYTFVYIRPKLVSADLIFPSISDSGTDEITMPETADSRALVNPWGVSGTRGSTSTEGNVEVQAFEQIGNVMYVGGNFRNVQRDASGTGRVEQSFLAAFNATTGEYLPGFTPTLNEQVRALTTLPNGDLVVGGDFTSVNGEPVQGLVALNPSSGAVASNWGVRIENGISSGVVRVNSLDVSDGYLYLAGSFTHLSLPDGSARRYARNAGRVDAGTAQPDQWNPEFNGTVLDLATSNDGERTYYSGFFGRSGTTTAWRAAAIMADTGQLDPVPWNPTWSSTNKDYQRSIDEHADRVWVGGSEHSLFDFSTATYERLGGSITKRGGDFQAIDVEGNRLFAGCHCNNWIYQDAYTWSNVGANWTQADAIGWFGQWDPHTGRYVPHFTPEFSLRLGSGIWAIEIAEDGTVWAGGDVTTGRTTAGSQWLGGFGRWAPRDTTAPGSPSNLRATTQDAESVRLAWNPASGASRYQVLRDDRVVGTTGGTALTVPKGGENRFFVRAVDSAGNVSTSTPVFSTGDGNPAPEPVIEHTASGLTVTFDATGSTDDTAITQYLWDFGDGSSSVDTVVEHRYERSGTYTVALTVVDNLGSFRTAQEDIEVTVPVPEDAYGSAVLADDPYLYWRLNEDEGDYAQDSSGQDMAGLYKGTITRDAEGALQVDDPGARFDGVSGYVVGAAGTEVTDPGDFSVEIWFRSTSAMGGKLIGFGDAASGMSSNYDRHVFLRNDGRLAFGVWTGAQNTVVSPDPYNDGEWHHIVATQNEGGMVLYVDGEAVGTNPETDAQAYTGYWRVGGDSIWGGASSAYVAADLDEAAIYHHALPPRRVAEHYAIGTGTPPPNDVPIADFTVTTAGLHVVLDGSASSDPDGAIVQYDWDLGDGTTLTGQSAEHAFMGAGAYTVTLTVTDDAGGSASATKPVTVAPLPNEAPVAAFDMTVEGLSVSVDAAESSDPDGEVASYE